MAVTLKETEGVPAAWPEVSRYPRAADWEGGAVTDEADPVIDPATVWRVIERWITTRWAARSVTYVAEGPGEWCARLDPFTAITTEKWETGWTAVTLDPSPLGGFELGEGIYRITGTAGDDSAVPEDAQEAWRRLHSYILGNSSETLDALAAYRTEFLQAPAGYAAKALQLSGAADLLRPYRRLGA